MRFFLTLLFVLALSIPAEAQQAKKVPRIGFLSATPSINAAFLEALHALGYIEKKNIIIEHRSGGTSWNGFLTSQQIWSTSRWI
jgi:hypothetical protein